MNRVVVQTVGSGAVGAVAGGIAGLGLNWVWGWVHSPSCTSREVRFCDIETDLVLPFFSAVWALVAAAILVTTLVVLERHLVREVVGLGCPFWLLMPIFFAMAGRLGSPPAVTALLVVAFALAGMGSATGPRVEFKRGEAR